MRYNNDEDNWSQENNKDLQHLQSTSTNKNSIKTIRFEMPYAVWCGECKRYIAKGILSICFPYFFILPIGTRFNASKQKIGEYFSTEIVEFCMNCPSCSNNLVIHSDPKNSDYTFHSGGTRKVQEFSHEDAETMPIKSDEYVKELATNPFLQLEVTTDDIKKSVQKKPYISYLLGKKDRLWKDDFKASQQVRKIFREDKKVTALKHNEILRMQKLSGLQALQIVPGSIFDEQDAQVAKGILFSNKTSALPVATPFTSIQRSCIFDTNRVSSNNRSKFSIPSSFLQQDKKISNLFDFKNSIKK